jgi:DNA-binding GntR family transcriptional regulator
MDHPNPEPAWLDDSTVTSLTTDEEQVIHALEEDILFGRLAPGARLTEDMLLARFNVTRHFVRQALFQLERLGIVVRERNKGASVRSMAPDQVMKIYDVRELVQRQAALWIPLPAPDVLIDELTEIHNEYRHHSEEGYLRGVHETNDRFHLTLFGACGNQYLVQAIQHYMRLTLPVRANSMADRKLRDVSIRHHEIMIEMLRGTDNWVLAQLCVDHLQPSKRNYLDRLVTTGGDRSGEGPARAARDHRTTAKTPAE